MTASAIGLLLHAYLYYRIAGRLERLEDIFRRVSVRHLEELDDVKKHLTDQHQSLQQSIHRAIFEFTTASKQMHHLLESAEAEPKKERNDAGLDNSPKD
ncbi:MAG: hypothetical protein PVF65_12655 [Sphingomonadales bacterium]